MEGDYSMLMSVTLLHIKLTSTVLLPSQDKVKKKTRHRNFFQKFFLVSPTNESNETKFLPTHDTPDLEFYVNCGKQMIYETL